MAFITTTFEAARVQLSTDITQSINPAMAGTANSGKRAALFDPFAGGPATGADFDLVADARPAYVSQDMHTDWHFRWRAIPTELRLANPIINTDIPFVLWNTFRQPQALQGINVDGSNVLTFELQNGDIIRDSSYFETSLQIGAGEANVDAVVTFDFPAGDARLPVIATVSETFNLVPDVPVRETWEWLTDVIKTQNGNEQRFSLRRNPRRNMSFRVDILDLQDRQEQWELLFKNVAVQAVIPAYHHATNLTATTGIGGTRLFMQMDQTQMRIGESVVVINPETESATVATVTAVNADSVDIGSSAAEELTSVNYVYPAHSMYITAGSGLSMQQVSGKMQIKAEGISAPDLVRPNSTVVLNTLDGFPIMEKRPLISAGEEFSFRREVLDYDTTVVSLLNLADPHPEIAGSRRWVVKRYTNPQDEDYMRLFLDTVRGGQKAFLLPTFFPDLTLASTPNKNSGQLEITENNYPSLLHVHETWKRIMIEYENLPPTYHVVSTAIVNEASGNTDLVITPLLADDDEAEKIKSISFLQKVRGTDTVRREHTARDTFYNWAIRTVEN